MRREARLLATFMRVWSIGRCSIGDSNGGWFNGAIAIGALAWGSALVIVTGSTCRVGIGIKLKFQQSRSA